MTPEELLKFLISELSANEFWIADAGRCQRALDERVTQTVLNFMKHTEAVEITGTDEQNLLAAVQMAGLGNIDQEALDSGAAQRVYDLACDVAIRIRERRQDVARRSQQEPAADATGAEDIDALLNEL